MIEGSLARRYTKALFQLAREAGQEEAVGREVEQFYAPTTIRTCSMVLTNPAFGVDTRKRDSYPGRPKPAAFVLTVAFLVAACWSATVWGT